MRSLLLAALLVVIPGFAANKSWQGKMKELATATNELMPELVARRPDKKVLLKQAKTLADLSHALSEDAAKKMGRPTGDGDESLPLIASQFAEDAKSAYAALKAGHVDYGVSLLRTVTTYCIACHTRNDAGPSFPSFPLALKTKSLKAGERADLYAATRQFDKAFPEYLAIVSSAKEAKERHLEWERAVRRGLALAIRVKKNPEMASQIVDKVLAEPSAPEFLKKNATKWKAAIGRWKEEPAPHGPASEATLHNEMGRLLKEAQTSQEYPIDTGGNVEYLRASAVAHELLGRFPDGKYAAEALLVAGIAYDVIADPTLWPSHQLYYEACVRKAPHTDLAERCFNRYEQSVYVGYSGSSGSFIPEEIMQKLVELKKTAAATTPSTPAP